MTPPPDTPGPSPHAHNDTINFLYGLRRTGGKLGLETTLRLADLAGNPHRHLKFIHVAGTNGKGSTCAMLESIYRHAGLQVGLYTSPHLSAFGERIQVNRQLISPTDTTRLVAELKPMLEPFPAQSRPTFFEFVTILALRYFKEQHCDLVIWETGLGGRLDSTNIVTPCACLITPVALDHQQWLGETLTAIAHEKAGIIKPGIPVFTSTNQPEALDAIQSTATSQGAPFSQVEPDEIHAPPLDTLPLPLPGRHQRLNAALALKAVRALRDQFPVTDPQIQAGLQSVHWPGRCEVAQIPGKGRFLLDGAHNPAAAQALVEAVKDRFPAQSPSLILGLFQDKEIKEIIRILAPAFPRILTVPIESERSTPPSDLAGFCRAAHPGANVTACDSLQQALDATATDAVVVITGSLHLVGQARDLLGLTPKGWNNERALNEWVSIP